MKGVVQRVDRTLDGLRAIPGVEAASTSGMLPGIPAQYQLEFKIDNKLDARPSDSGGQPICIGGILRCDAHSTSCRRSV